MNDVLIEDKRLTWLWLAVLVSGLVSSCIICGTKLLKHSWNREGEKITMLWVCFPLELFRSNTLHIGSICSYNMVCCLFGYLKICHLKIWRILKILVQVIKGQCARLVFFPSFFLFHLLSWNFGYIYNLRILSYFIV